MTISVFLILVVVQSNVASFVGANGIMIRETAETFSIITADNKLHGKIFKPVCTCSVCYLTIFKFWFVLYQVQVLRVIVETPLLNSFQLTCYKQMSICILKMLKEL